MKSNRFVLLTLMSILISSCMTVGPDYQKPANKMPAKWDSTLEGGEKADPAQIAEWWKGFGDPILDTLVTRAIDANFDLRIAESRIREARAGLQMTESDLWPQLNASGSYRRSQSPKPASATGSGGSSFTFSPDSLSVTGTQVNPDGSTISFTPDLTGGGNSRLTVSPGSGQRAPSRQSDLFQAGFDASWELDLFGGTRRAVEAAKADINVAEENRHDVQMTLIAEVARNYFNLRRVQNSLDIANNNIRIQKESLELARARFQAGLTSELDVKIAEAQLATTTSAVPVFETAISQYIHRLGGLLGREPGAFQAELSPVAVLPKAPPEVPVGLPSELLRRRPDVRRAERELAAATARIGVATADLFPKFSLTGSFAGQSATFESITRGANNIWSIGPGIKWPIFDAGRIRANIQVQNARQEQALTLYEKTVMGTLEEVENALVAYAKEQNRFLSLSEAVDANRRALDIANELYTKGLVTFLNVLDAERSLFSAEDQLAQSKATILTNLVSLYKALGGGWSEIEPKVDTQPTS